MGKGNASPVDCIPGFNRAAPFRERLFWPAPGEVSDQLGLQSCRPLSGAVIHPAHPSARRFLLASIVPPPFGSGYDVVGIAPARQRAGFNRAAPFRERLCDRYATHSIT